MSGENALATTAASTTTAAALAAAAPMTTAAAPARKEAPVAPARANGTPDPGAGRTLWLAGYVVLMLAPLALMAVVVKPGNDSVGTIVAAGLGFVGLTILVLQIAG